MQLQGRPSYKYHVKFPEIHDIFSKYLAFSPKYLEKILNILDIFLSFFYKYHNNEFIKSKTSFIGKTGMRHSLYKVTTSTCERVQYIATDATAAFSGFLPWHDIHLYGKGI